VWRKCLRGRAWEEGASGMVDCVYVGCGELRRRDWKIWDIKEILFVCLHELFREDALFLTVEGVVITLSVRHRSKGVSV